MRNLVLVALTSAFIGAGLAHWTTVVTRAGAQGTAADARVSPLELMKSSGRLPVEEFDEPM